MKTGVVFDPLVLDVTPTKIHLRDGHHRLRAYQFLKELEKIPVSVAGCVNKILHACCKEPRSIKSNGSSIEIHTPRPQGDLHPSQ
jgi:hypothetical protein